ncbi:hypothetical protein [Secundilactobacillus paracollinoides]
MSDKVGTVALESSSGQPMGNNPYGGPSYSGETAAAIDEEVRRLLNEGHETAKKIISEHREQHKLIAQALLKYETLDEKQILSLFNTGEMPSKDNDSEFPSEKAATFEQSKAELERREAARHQEQETNTETDQSTDDQADDQTETPKSSDDQTPKATDDGSTSDKPHDDDSDHEA